MDLNFKFRLFYARIHPPQDIPAKIEGKNPDFAFNYKMSTFAGCNHIIK